MADEVKNELDTAVIAQLSDQQYAALEESDRIGAELIEAVAQGRSEHEIHALLQQFQAAVAESGLQIEVPAAVPNMEAEFLLLYETQFLQYQNIEGFSDMVNQIVQCCQKCKGGDHADVLIAFPLAIKVMQMAAEYESAKAAGANLSSGIAVGGSEGGESEIDTNRPDFTGELSETPGTPQVVVNEDDVPHVHEAARIMNEAKQGSIQSEPVAGAADDMNLIDDAQRQAGERRAGVAYMKERVSESSSLTDRIQEAMEQHAPTAVAALETAREAAREEELVPAGR